MVIVAKIELVYTNLLLENWLVYFLRNRGVIRIIKALNINIVIQFLIIASGI